MKRSKIILIALALLISAICLVACGEKDKTPDPKIYTVRFLDGANEVSHVDVTEGDKLTAEQIPVAPGGHDDEIFDGWFVGDEQVQEGYEPKASVSVLAVFHTPLPDWREDEKEIMRAHLHGVVLPYFDKDNNKVDFDDDSGELVVAGATVTFEEVKAYAAIYMTSGEWKDASDMYEGGMPVGWYAFEKQVQTDDGIRYVYAEFGALDEEGDPALTATGSFALTAYDPYLYEFPTDIFAIFTSDMFGSNEEIPAFESDHYLMTQYSDSYNNELIAVLCYTTDAAAEKKYKDILTNANWSVDEEKDEGGFVNAYTSDNAFGVSFKYNTSLRGLAIYIIIPKLIPEAEWPGEWLPDVFAAYNWPAFDIPVFDFEGALYIGYEDENDLIYYITDKTLMRVVIEAYGADEAIYNAYLEELEDNGWTLADEGDVSVYNKEIEGKIATIDIEYTDEAVHINVYLYLKDKPLPAWPYDDIVELIADPYITDVVPAYEGTNASGYAVHEAWILSSAYVEIFVPVGEEEAALAAYEATIIKAGYTVYGDEGLYLSPNGQLYVLPSFEEDGAIYVYFSAASPKVWPSNVVSGELLKRGFTDELPALEVAGATYEYKFGTMYNPDCLQISVECADSDEAEQQRAAYEEALKAAGFTQSDDYTDDLSDYVFYVSPASQYKIEIWIQSGNMIYIEISAI